MASTSDSQSNDKRLLSQVDDALERAQRFGACRFIGFLDEREVSLVRQHLLHKKSTAMYCFFGGHPEAERAMLAVGCCEEDMADESFPMTALDIRWRNSVSLTHRDVLGSLLGCGIARHKIGDILCEDGRAVVFVAQELADYLMDTLRTVGREGVRLEYPAALPYPVFHRYREITGTVASARLDSVMKVLLGVSREQACELIRKGIVQVNHVEASSVSMTVGPTDRLSVRGYGRYVVDDISQLTKKGRIVLCARQFV